MEKPASREELLQEIARYRAMLENVRDVIFTTDGEGKFTYLSPSASQYGSFDDEQPLGKSLLGWVHPDDREQAQQGMLATIQGHTAPREFRLVGADGSLHYVRTNSRVLKEGDRVVGLVGVLSDITERKQAELALQESEARYRELVEHAPAGVFETDLANQRITTINDVACQFLGYERDELAGLSMFSLLDDAGQQVFIERLRRLAEGEPVSDEVEYRIRRKDGTYRWINVHTNIAYDEAGRAVRSRAIAHDVTERKELEDELAKAQRLEVLSVLAGGIAHDFNNVLAGIRGRISLAQTAVNDGGGGERHLREADAACEHAARLTQQLLTFTAGGGPVKTASDTIELVTESCRFAVHGSAAKLDFQLPEQLWPVAVDAGQMSQVFNNLALNAAQAMPSGGVIEVKGRNETVAAEADGGLPPGRYACVTIRDHGPGIAPSLLPKIFEAFVTTKSRGTGLGLASAHTIVERHGGVMKVESTPGDGAFFHVWLPACDEPPAAAESQPADAPQGSGHILFMDDELSLQSIVEQALSAFGYQVDVVSDGAAAVRRYAEAQLAGEPFDAVILDLTVAGGMGGKEALDKLLAVDPNVKAIVSSGYSADPVLTDHQAHGFRAAIRKPYKLQRLNEVLQAVLSNESAAAER